MAAPMGGTKWASDIEVNYRTFFDDVFHFLFEFDWIHNFLVTKFFVCEIWTRIPSDWHDFLLSLSLEQLNRLPYEDREGEENYPDSFRRFLQISHKLSLQRTPARKSCSSSVDTSLGRGMTPKKLHEVANMSVVVDENASKAGCDVIVDIGSGLGYLGQMLHKTYGYSVIGVEGCAGHTQRAEKRSVKQDLQENCIKNVTFNLDPSQEHMSEFEVMISAALREIKHCQHTHTREQACDLGRSCDHVRSCNLVESCDQGQSCDLNTACGHVQSCDHCQSCHVTKSLDRGQSCDQDWSCHRGQSCDRFQLSSNSSATSNVCGSDKLETPSHGIISSLDSAENFGSGCFCKSNIKGCQEKINKNGQTHFTEISQRIKVQQDNSNSCVGNFCVTQSENEVFARKCETEKNSFKCAGLGTSGIDRLETCDKCVCMIGLHCCGDLTPTMLHYFLEMPKVRCLCLVSCCYHKMGHNPGESKFHRFPLSRHCQDSYSEIQKIHPDWRLQPVSMRLAAQETRSRWQNQTEADHSTHTRHVAYRGLLEVFFQEAGLDGEKMDRKIIRKADFSSFDSFTSSIIQGLDVCEDVGAKYRQHMQEIHDRYSPYLGFIEIITALQVIVQPVLERLIQQDRQAYIIQHGIQAQLVPIFDENISPRNMALIAHKE